MAIAVLKINIYTFFPTKLWLKKHRYKDIRGSYSYFIRLSILMFIVLFFLSTAGCDSNHRPRLRLGAYFGAPFGIAYPNPEKLGKHMYSNCWGESIGLVYTSKGGFIDLGHVRDSADRTAYCSQVTYANLIRGNHEFTYRVMEPSKYCVKITYPENWEQEIDKEKIAKEVSIKVGQYLAYNSMVWHEMITWFGYKYTILFSEYISSFSWEDVYSDIIGVDIAGRALKDESGSYDNLMTKLIYEELKQLDVQQAKTAKKAEKKIKGKWFNGTIYPFTKLKKRNFDTGLDDGYVTPWLVPGICENTEKVSYAVPDSDFLNEYGFSFKVKIEPNISVKKKILKVVYPYKNGEYIIPDEHFSKIMEHIIEKEKAINGPEVNVPNL